MTLRCKQGDLAVMVRSMAGNNGKVFKCIRLATTAEMAGEGFDFKRYGPMWFTDARFNCSWGHTTNLCFDFQIRPLRNDPGQDETLTWKDVPSTDKGTA